MSVDKQIPASDPVMRAWDRYKTGDEYANTRKWALVDEAVDGSLWASFFAGWSAAEREHEEGGES